MMGGGDKRVRRSRDRVLAPALELLGERGGGGFPVDEVVRRSGVAKTTVYRHWPTREALVLDAASRISAEQEVPDTGSLEGDLQRGHAVAVRAVLQRAVDKGELPASADHSVIVSALIGPLYYRRWFSREPIDEAFIATIVANVVR